MKYLICCFFLVSSFGVSVGQDVSKLDSLRGILLREKADTATVMTLHELAFNFIYANTDSAIWYAQKAKALSLKLDYKHGEIRSNIDIGVALTNKSNYTKALEVFLDALQQAEKSGDAQMQSAALGDISENFMNKGDYSSAIRYTFKSLAFDRAANDTLYLLYDFINLADYFEKNNQADSALIFANQAYQLNLKLNRADLMEGTLLSLGNTQAHLGNDDLALVYFRKGLVLSKKSGNVVNIEKGYMALANIFRRANKNDSARSYATNAFTVSQAGGYPQGILESSTGLASLYEKTSNDSTFKYLKLSVALKDSLFEQERVKQYQNLTFAENLRQEEIAQLKLSQAESRRHNLQLMGIGAFIPIFFAIVMLLSRKKADSRVIEYMGLLGLLLAFEFISLFLHPYIVRWTNDTPLFILLILVALAAFLVPAHHRLELWMKKKFTHRVEKVSPSGKTIDAVAS